MIIKGVRYNWTIASSDSEWNWIPIEHVNGTLYQVQKYLMKMVKDDRELEDNFDCGTSTIKDMDVKKNSVYAYSVFNDHHIDYVASIDTEPLKLK